MTSSLIGNYFVTVLNRQTNNYNESSEETCLCTNVTHIDGVNWCTMQDWLGQLHTVSVRSLKQGVVPTKTPQYSVGDLVYADVSNKAGFSYDCQSNCQITKVKVFCNDISYEAVIADAGHVGQHVYLYAKDILRKAQPATPQPTREQQLTELREHEAMLLQQLAAVRRRM